MDIKKVFAEKKAILIFLLSYVSLIYSFFLNEDGTGVGARGDFEVTYGFILALQENLLSNPIEWTLVHTPLHFVILSFVTRIIQDPYYLRLCFCLFSIVLPILFLKILLLNNENKNNNNLIIICSCIFFLPAFRYTSIWANDLITSLIFFLLSVIYFKKWEINKKSNIDKNIIFQILLLACATYTRQYFAVFFIFFLYKYYLFLTKKSFISLFLICVLTSIPVFFYTYMFPELLTGQHISLNAVNYFLLGNSSIMFLYIFPIFLINIILKKIKITKNILKYFLVSLIFVILLSFNFNPIDWQGGGINYMVSQKLFKNNIYFFITSILSFTFFIYLFFEKKENIILILILLIMFFSFQVYQRYYEPMFFLIYFTLFQTNTTKVFFENTISVLLLFFYFIIYYFGAVSDIIYKLN